MIGQSFTHRRYKIARAADGQIWLDDKQLVTPARRTVALPPALATAVAAEWNAQGEKINPPTMPLTQLAFTAIDRTADNRAQVIDDLLNYLDTELICHYGDTPELIAYQNRHWQPLHDWLQEKFGITLPVTSAIQPVRAVQDTGWARTHLDSLDDLRLTAVQQVASLSGSLVIGLALAEQQCDAAAALDAAEAEADFQAQKWGKDDDYLTRRAGLLADMQAAEKFISLLG